MQYQILPKSSLDIITALTIDNKQSINKLAQHIINSANNKNKEAQSRDSLNLIKYHQTRESDLIDIDPKKLKNINDNLVKVIPVGADTKVKIIFSENIKVFLIKQNQEIEINHENLPEDLKRINTSKLFESTLRNAYIKVSTLSNGEIKLYINQRLYGGGNSASNNNIKGDEYFKSGDYSTAKSYYHQARNLDPGNTTYKANLANTFNRIGNEFFEQNKYDEALESYNEALNLCSNTACYHSNKASTLNQLKRYGEALEAANAALKIESNYEHAKSTKANSLNQIGLIQDKPPIGGSLAFYISCQLLLSKVICKSLQIIRVKDGNNR